MISPSSLAVLELKFLQKSMMFSPWGPSAVPTGGAGVAFPAAIWSFTIACIFFAILRCARLSVTSFQLPADRCSQLPAGSWEPAAGCRQLQFFYLQKVQFHRCGTSENRDHHLERVAIE